MGGAGAQGALVVTNMKMKVTTMKGGGVGVEGASEITTGLCVTEKLQHNNQVALSNYRLLSVFYCLSVLYCLCSTLCALLSALCSLCCPSSSAEAHRHCSAPAD